MRKKRLLLLGGSRYALPVIEAAHEMGCLVATCDYLPDNYAHRFSDEYINVSIVERGEVLEAARSFRADGIMSFAADPGVVAAAYAAEEMGLPFQAPLSAVEVLQDKRRFRAFLAEHNFNCPEARAIGSVDEARSIAESLAYPLIVKPADSAGSKGCSRVDSPDGLAVAVETALSCSIAGGCIAERFLEKAGDSSDADGFAVGGKLACVSFTSQLFDAAAENPYTPAAYVMPASMPDWAQKELDGELQRLCDLLGVHNGIFNIETRVATDGRAYIMEFTPRGGGNRLSEMLRFASGVDLIRASVQAALGLPIEDVHVPVYNGYWYQEMLHSDRGGTFQGISYAPCFKETHVADEQLWVSVGDTVGAFTGANRAFGSVMMRFETEAELAEFRADPSAYVRVEVN